MSTDKYLVSVEGATIQSVLMQCGGVTKFLEVLLNETGPKASSLGVSLQGVLHGEHLATIDLCVILPCVPLCVLVINVHKRCLTRQ